MRDRTRWDRWRRKAGGGKAFQAVGLSLSKNKEARKNICTSENDEEMNRANSGAERLERYDEANLRYHRRVLRKDLEYMQVWYFTVCPSTPNRSRHPQIPFLSFLLPPNRTGSYQILMLPVAGPPAAPLREFRFWSYFVVFLGKHVKSSFSFKQSLFHQTLKV